MPGYAEIVYSVHDLKLAILNSSDVPGTNIDLPGVRSAGFSPQASSDELGGDGVIMATAMGAKSVDIEIETGRSNPTAVVAILGGTLTTTGTTPNQIDEHTEGGSSVRYLQLIAQANGADKNGSAYRLTALKASLTEGIDEALAYEEWSIPSMTFKAVDKAGALLKRQWYETAVAIA